jgi:hypothetical protein
MMTKSLDEKLDKLRADPRCGEFILADAKDADMAYGIAACGKSPEHHAHEGRFRSLEEYRGCIRQVVRQGLVDIVLMSAHTNAILTMQEGIFEGSPITPAARANDTTDIHVARGWGLSPTQPSQPVPAQRPSTRSSAATPTARRTRAHPRREPRPLQRDLQQRSRSVDRAHARCTTRRSASRRKRKGFRHFLEVFAPNAPQQPARSRQARRVHQRHDRAHRWPGVPESGRPAVPQDALPRDPGSPRSWPGTIPAVDHRRSWAARRAPPTTPSSWSHDAQKYGARVALFGRKINNAEHQLAFIDDCCGTSSTANVSPEEAVHAYHGVLHRSSASPPHRPLPDDPQAHRQRDRATAAGRS